MSLYQKFATDADLETGTGLTLDYGDFKITIHRAGGSNRKFAKLLQEKLKPYRRMMDAGNMDEDVSLKIMAEVYAQSVIIGWDGVKDASGKKLPFTIENAVKVMTDLPDFFTQIQEEATRAANFRKAEIEADTKNSVKS